MNTVFFSFYVFTYYSHDITRITWVLMQFQLVACWNACSHFSCELKLFMCSHVKNIWSYVKCMRFVCRERSKLLKRISIRANEKKQMVYLAKCTTKTLWASNYKMSQNTVKKNKNMFPKWVMKSICFCVLSGIKFNLHSTSVQNNAFWASSLFHC